MTMKNSLQESPPFRMIFTNLLFSMTCLAIAFSSQSSHAADCEPFQISIVPSVQLIPKENTICGARLNLLWGNNASVTGVDAGLVNVEESLKGIEIGVLNWLAGRDRKESWGLQMGGINYTGNSSFTGGQIGFFNAGSSKASITGIQAAAINLYEGEINGMQISVENGARWTNVNGLQLAIIGNSAADLHGMQMGLANAAETLHGIQIGFGNYAKDVHGIQIGLLFNVCESLSGVQIGIFNVVSGRFPDKGLFFFPLINAGF